MEMPSVRDAATFIRTGELSSEELTRACLEAIEVQNPALNAFVFVDADRAMASAQEVDDIVRDGRLEELGPLAGVPFGVKDLEDCAGMPTTRGSRWYADGPSKTSDDSSTSVDCDGPGRSPSARPRRPSSARGPIPRARCSASLATRGTSSERPEAPAGDPAPRCRAAWCPSPPRATAEVRSVRPRASPAWSVSSAPTAASPPSATPISRRTRSSGASRRPSPTPPSCST